MSKNKKIGSVLLILPVAFFIISLVGFAVTGIMIESSLSGMSGPVPVSWRILRLVLSIVGMLGIIGLFTLVPAGIYFIVKNEEPKKQ